LLFLLLRLALFSVPLDGRGIRWGFEKQNICNDLVCHPSFPVFTGRGSNLPASSGAKKSTVKLKRVSWMRVSQNGV
jgi:hypothetical protein